MVEPLSNQLDLEKVSDNDDIKTYKADPEQLKAVYGHLKHKSPEEIEEDKKIVKDAKSKQIYESQIERRRRYYKPKPQKNWKWPQGHQTKES